MTWCMGNCSWLTQFLGWTDSFPHACWLEKGAHDGGYINAVEKGYDVSPKPKASSTSWRCVTIISGPILVCVAIF